LHKPKVRMILLKIL